MKVKIAATVLLLTLSGSFASAQLEFRTESPIDSMSSFDMNGNRIFNLSDPVEGQDATTKAWTENTFVNRNGDTLTGVLDFNGNNVQLSDAYISNDGEDEGIVIDDQGNVMISQGNLELLDNGNVTGLYSLEAENEEIEVRDSIDLDGNNITDIGTLLFETGLTVNGSINTSGGDVNLDNGSIGNVYSIGGGGDAVKFSDNIDLNGNTLTDSSGDVEIDSSVYIPGGSLDMAGNNIVNPGNVDGVDLEDPGNGLEVSDSRLGLEEDAVGDSELNNTQEFTVDGIVTSSDINLSGNDIQTGGGTVAIRDESGGQDIARFNEDGEVEVPSGNLVVSGGGVSTTDGSSTTPSLGFNDDSDTGLYRPGDGSIGIVSNGDEGLRLRNDGNVDILGSDIAGVGGESAATSGALRIANDENIVFRNSGNSGNIEALSVDASNNIELPGGDVEISGGGLTVNDGIQVSNPVNSDNSADIGGSLGVEGSLDMNGNEVQNVDTVSGSSGQALALTVSGTGGDELVLDSTGDVRVGNGDLDLQGNSVVDSTSSDTVYVGDGTDDAVVLDAPGDVQVEGGNLDLEGASITNYYGDSCPDGETVVDVQDNGQFQCMDVSDEVMDQFVSRSGDSMTGDLDMRENDVYNVSNVGVGTDNPQENLDVDGTASVESSGTTMEVDSTGDVVVTLGG